GLSVDHRGGLADVPRQTHSARHPIELAQGECEIPLRRVTHADAPLPFPKAVQLRAVPGGNRLAVGILVLPPDRRRETLVMDRVRHRGARPGTLLALFHVERAPLRTLIDHLVRQDEAALLADEDRPIVGDVLDHAETPHAPSRPGRRNAWVLYKLNGIFL